MQREIILILWDKKLCLGNQNLYLEICRDKLESFSLGTLKCLTTIHRIIIVYLIKERYIEQVNNFICIPESFDTNISHQLFNYKITSVHSQRENTNSKGEFVLKNRFITFVLKISGIQKINLTQIWYYNFN
jgi:hypothetical protein